MPEDEEDAELEHALAHLRFEVFDVHNSVFSGEEKNDGAKLMLFTVPCNT